MAAWLMWWLDRRDLRAENRELRLVLARLQNEADELRDSRTALRQTANYWRRRCGELAIADVPEVMQ